MMTLEKTIECIKEIKDRAWGWHINGEVLGIDYDEFIEIMDTTLTALRSVSREQVEKVRRGEWIIPTIIGGRAYNIPHCSACNGVPCGTDEHTRFCAHCGAPMTDEAVEMVMERWKEAVSE